ncbi:MAG: restriction endonuclease subunit S [Methylococcales bacterium]
MIKWPMKPLGEVCEINPRLPRNHDISDEREVSFVPMASVDEVSGLIADRQARRFADVRKGYTHFKDSDVLFAKITPCMENGKAAIARDLAGGIGFGSTEFHGFRSRGDVLPEWVFYFVRRQRFRADAKRNFTGTAGQQRVPTSFVEAAQIPVPSLADQRHIVDILSRAEGIVRLRREARKKAAEIIPALFLDMFGDPATNQKRWEKLRLDEVSEISYGIADKLDTSITAEKGTRILTISNVLLEGAIDQTVFRFCKATEAQVRKCSVQRGDLLFNWRNGSDTHIGKTAIWESDDHVLHVSFLLRLRPNMKRLNSYFIWAMLNLMRARDFFLGASRQQINRKFNASELSALVLPIPPKELQDRCCQQIEQVRSVQNQQISATQKAEATFDVMIGQAFQGRL